MRKKGRKIFRTPQNAVYKNKMAGHINIDIMGGILAICLFRSTA